MYIGGMPRKSLRRRRIKRQRPRTRRRNHRKYNRTRRGGEGIRTLFSRAKNVTRKVLKPIALPISIGANVLTFISSGNTISRRLIENNGTPEQNGYYYGGKSKNSINLFVEGVGFVLYEVDSKVFKTYNYDKKQYEYAFSWTGSHNDNKIIKIIAKEEEPERYKIIGNADENGNLDPLYEINKRISMLNATITILGVEYYDNRVSDFFIYAVKNEPDSYIGKSENEIKLFVGTNMFGSEYIYHTFPTGTAIYSMTDKNKTFLLWNDRQVFIVIKPTSQRGVFTIEGNARNGKLETLENIEERINKLKIKIEEIKQNAKKEEEKEKAEALQQEQAVPQPAPTETVATQQSIAETPVEPPETPVEPPETPVEPPETPVEPPDAAQPSVDTEIPQSTQDQTQPEVQEQPPNGPPTEQPQIEVPPSQAEIPPITSDTPEYQNPPFEKVGTSMNLINFVLFEKLEYNSKRFRNGAPTHTVYMPNFLFLEGTPIYRRTVNGITQYALYTNSFENYTYYTTYSRGDAYGTLYENYVDPWDGDRRSRQIIVNDIPETILVSVKERSKGKYIILGATDKDGNKKAPLFDLLKTYNNPHYNQKGEFLDMHTIAYFKNSQGNPLYNEIPLHDKAQSKYRYNVSMRNIGYSQHYNISDLNEYIEEVTSSYPNNLTFLGRNSKVRLSTNYELNFGKDTNGKQISYFLFAGQRMYWYGGDICVEVVSEDNRRIFAIRVLCGKLGGHIYGLISKKNKIVAYPVNRNSTNPDPKCKPPNKSIFIEPKFNHYDDIIEPVKTHLGSFLSPEENNFIITNTIIDKKESFGQKTRKFAAQAANYTRKLFQRKSPANPSPRKSSSSKSPAKSASRSSSKSAIRSASRRSPNKSTVRSPVKQPSPQVPPAQVPPPQVPPPQVQPPSQVQPPQVPPPQVPPPQAPPQVVQSTAPVDESKVFIIVTDRIINTTKEAETRPMFTITSYGKLKVDINDQLEVISKFHQNLPQDSPKFYKFYVGLYRTDGTKWKILCRCELIKRNNMFEFTYTNYDVKEELGIKTNDENNINQLVNRKGIHVIENVGIQLLTNPAISNETISGEIKYTMENKTYNNI